MALDDHQLRNLRLAEWNAREAIVREAVNDSENVDYHCAAARECLMIVGGCRVGKWMTPSDLAGLVADLKDAHGVV